MVPKTSLDIKAFSQRASKRNFFQCNPKNERSKGDSPAIHSIISAVLSSLFTSHVEPWTPHPAVRCRIRVFSGRGAINSRHTAGGSRSAQGAPSPQVTRPIIKHVARTQWERHLCSVSSATYFSFPSCTVSTFSMSSGQDTSL